MLFLIQYAFQFFENGLNLGFNPLNLFFGLLDTLLNSQICKDAIKKVICKTQEIICVDMNIRLNGDISQLCVEVSEIHLEFGNIALGIVQVAVFGCCAE